MLTKKAGLGSWPEHAELAERQAFAVFFGPLNASNGWFMRKDFAGPEAVLAYLSRYTHRVAISDRRLIAADASTVTFKVKDYRLDGAARFKTMTLATGEFIRRFLMHVFPRASIASAIMACLPMAPAPGTSPRRASCSLSRCL